MPQNGELQLDRIKAFRAYDRSRTSQGTGQTPTVEPPAGFPVETEAVIPAD
jgi:hypothetical protein